MTTVFASLPAPDVMSRWWNMPDADEQRLRQMVSHRLEADLPLPIDQLTWECRRLHGAPAGPQGRWVLTQAAPRDRVARDMAALAAAGLRVDAMTTEAEAVGALYRHGINHSCHPGTEGIVLATADEWVIAVLTGGLTRSVRRIRVAADDLDVTCRECRQAIEAEVPLREVHRLLWCGSSETTPARQKAAESLGLTVEVVEPHRQLVEVGGTALTSGQLAAFGPALGLALAGLLEHNTVIRLAGREQDRIEAGRRRVESLLRYPWAWMATAIGLLIVTLIIHVAAIKWETRQMQTLLKGWDKTQSTAARIEPKYRALLRLEKYRIDVEGTIADLCRVVPDSIVISSIQLSREQRLVIKGTASDPKAIFKLADDLRTGERFASVNPERSEPGQGGSFTLTADLADVRRLTAGLPRGGL
ncbi:MAG TPA: hypothetical protein P5159_01235 [Phycisphaerae bacterium]|nr:hypothetical protein [Phycisphaerae bacterium]